MICFNEKMFLISIVILTLIILYFNKNMSKDCKCPKCECNMPMINTEKPLTKDDLINKRDDGALNNPLRPPTRRLPRHIYPSDAIDELTEIPTRGAPDSYHYYGNLRRSSDDKIVKLFGRQTYPGSHKYEYYGIYLSSNGENLKIPIEVTNDNELYDKDTIEIDFLGAGAFTLYMNDYDRPRYNPFIV